jgi:hypothetical protein
VFFGMRESGVSSRPSSSLPASRFVSRSACAPARASSRPSLACPSRAGVVASFPRPTDSAERRRKKRLVTPYSISLVSATASTSSKRMNL